MRAAVRAFEDAAVRLTDEMKELLHELSGDDLHTVTSANLWIAPPPASDAERDGDGSERSAPGTTVSGVFGLGRYRPVAGVGAGIGIALLLIAAGLGVGLGIGVGAATGAALGLAGRKSGPVRPRIDPFTVGEPWRQLVQAAQRSGDRLHDTVESTSDGPIKKRLQVIAGRIDDGVDESWRIAQRGHELDSAIRQLDPTALRSKLATLQSKNEANPNVALATAIASVEAQLATSERLKQRAVDTVNSLRLAQTRLDELASRSAEIALGAGDTERYEHEVDDLVIELEALRQAVQLVEGIEAG